MSADIGPKIGVEGEKQFKDAIKAVNSQIKTTTSELKRLEAQSDKSDNATKSLSDRQKALENALNASQQKVKLLTAQYDRQKSKLDELSTAIDKAKKENGEGSDEAIKAENAYSRQAREVNNLETQINNTRTQISGISKDLENNAVQLKEAESRAIKYGDAMQAAGDKISAVGTTVSKAGGALTLGVTTPLLAAGITAIHYASDAEESANKVEVSFGNSAQKVKEFADSTVDSYGISRGAALDMAALFGDMGTSMQIPQDQAAEMATSLVGLAGDIASFKNAELGAVQNALKGIFTGETESLKNLGIVMTETNLKTWAMENGFTGVWDSLSQGEKVTLRYKYVMEQTKKAQGDYMRTSNGTANSLRTMQESGKELAETFGKELLPEITPLIQGGTKLIKGFTRLDNSQRQLIIKTAATAAAAGPVLKIVGTATTGVGKLTSGVGGLVKDMGKLSAAKKAAEQVGKLTAATAQSVEGVSGLSKVLFKLASPTGIAVLAGAAVAAIGVAALKARDDIIKANIAKHFGDISLSAKEVEDIATRLTTTEWTVKVGAVMEAREKLEGFEQEIRSALDDINKLNWKVSAGLILTEDEQNAYISSVEQFVKSATDYVSQQGYTVSLAIDATLGADTSSGAGLTEFANAYYISAEKELNVLGKQLSDKVNKAFEDGTFAEDQINIQKIINQMNAITQKISDAKYKAKLTNMKIGYADEGYGIDQDSFNRLNSKISENTQQLMKDVEATRITALTAVEFQYEDITEANVPKEFADKIYENAKSQIELSTMEKQGEAINVGFDFAFDTVSQNFSDEVTNTKQSIEQSTQEFSDSIVTSLEGVNGEFLNWREGFETSTPEVSKGLKDTISSMLEALNPQKEQLEAIAQNCIKTGKAVPESVKKGLADIAEWEAIGGNVDGMYTMLVQNISQNPGQLEAMLKTHEISKKIPEEMANAISLYTGLLYDPVTRMFSEVQSTSALSAAEVKAYLNGEGKNLDEALANSIAAECGLVKNAQDGLWAEISASNAANASAKKAENVTSGGAVAAGVAEGYTTELAGQSDTVEAATVALVGAGKAGIESALPGAEKTAESGGKKVGEEFAEGIDSTEPEVDKSASDLAKSATLEMQTAIDEVTLSPPAMSTPDWTDAARDGRAGMQEYLNNNALSVRVNTSSGAIGEHATGGIFSTPHIALVAEEAPGEAIIPLAASRRSSALELWEETGRRLGAESYNDMLSASYAKGARASGNNTTSRAKEAAAKSVVFSDGAVKIYAQGENAEKIYQLFKTRLNQEVKRKKAGHGIT